MIQTSPSIFRRHRNGVLDRVEPYIPGPTSADVSEKYGIPGSSLTKLSSNEAPLGPALEIRDALHTIADSDELHRYPSPSMVTLRTAIARDLGLEPAQIVMGCGSSETWGMIVRAFSAPGDEVLAVEPSMSSYRETALLCEREPRAVTAPFPFDTTPDAVLAAVTPRTRVIFISSPNNTTSRLVPQTVIAEIANGAPDAIVVVDEHYIEAADNYRTASAIGLVPRVPNVLVTRSLSKMYGLAGVRVGYAAGPKEAIDVLAQFKPKWNVSILAEKSALAALAATAHLAANIEVTRAGRDQMLEAMRAMPLELVPHAQGGFLLFRPTQRPGAEVSEGLFSRGIMVRGDLLDGWIRVSVGTREQNQRFIDVLGELVA